MHRALSVPDILHELFDHFREYKDPSDPWFDIMPRYPLPRAALLKAALACRAFCVPALKVLWSEMSSIDPFWGLLCLDDAFVPDSSAAARRMSFYRYSSWVLELSLNDMLDWDLPRLQKACSLLDDHPFFPRLKYLRIYLMDSPTLPTEMATFISSTLLSFKLYVSVNTDCLGPQELVEQGLILRGQGFFDALADRAGSTLESLSVDCDTVLGFETSADRFSSLSHFSVHSLRILRPVVSFSSMELLKELHASVGLLNVSSGLAVPSLQSLHLRGPVALALETLAKICAPRLAELKCCLALGALDDLSLYMASSCKFESLAGVCIEFTGEDRHGAPLRAEDVLRLISPVLSANLEEIAISYYGGPFILTDANVQQMVSSIPRVRQLELRSYGRSGHRQSPSLQALSTIAEGCPELEKLTIPLDLYVRESRNMKPDTIFRPTSHPLRLVDFIATAVDDDMIPDLALILDTLFPNLCPDEWAGYWEKHRDIYKGIYDPVRKAIRKLQKARTFERARIRALS
ncbi:hypothetical protein OE88DRAFT_23071 [Heliocybe sulcata]|uniref:F-box domain-containing protein n=1 Tax=Heliocybe sulcata TaxID=5364 RepID=A0A5C3NGF8_9AGAM|nr:hypothetical protein OE88DRAFT_23071 [Heliocybe sulcata]